MKRFYVGLVVLAVVPISSCQLIPPGPHSTEKPLWTTDLRDATHTWDSLHAPAFFQATRQIAFGSDAELVVAKDSGPFAKPNEVRGIVMDAKNGSVLREEHWISGSWPFLFATSTGKYAVVTQAGMAVYSHGLQNVLATGSHVADKASPDGRFLSATETIPGHGTTIFIDADTLKPNGAEFRDVYVWSIADNRIASSALRNTNGIMLVTDVRKQLAEYETDCKDVRPNFISSDLLAVLGCQRVDVVSLARGKVFSSTVEGDEIFFATASRDGSRFAIIQIFVKAGDPPRLSKERVTVFDVVQRQPVFVTDISDLRGSNLGESSGVALSPNGSSLAINSAGVVRLFALRVQ
jgi:hypothetical protein